MAEKRRVICDFIAGMTDRYAVQFYGRLFGTNPESVFSPL
jgi:dGTPase